MKKTILIILALGLALPVQAAIPKFWTISSMLARNRNNKPLKVVQDVVVKDEETGGALSVRETIYVKNGELIKIKLQGKDLLNNQVRTSFLYKGNKKIFNNAGTVSTSQIPTGFYSPLLYTKSATGLRKYLNVHGYIPADGLTAPQVIISKDETYKPEPYVHLSRTNGKISFAITRQLSTVSNPSPTIWVNQNSFLLGKIRIDKDSIVSLSKYKEFGKKNWQPQKQVIKWKKYTYEINTVSVNAISESQVRKELSTNNLTKDGDLTNYNNNALETFYKVFR